MNYLEALELIAKLIRLPGTPNLKLARIWGYLYCQIDDLNIVDLYWDRRKQKAAKPDRFLIHQ